MKRILYLVSTLRKTGPIIVLANIIKHLDRSKFEPLVLSLSPEPEDSLKEHFERKLNVKVESLGMSRPKGLVLAKRAVSEYVSRHEVCLVHSHGFRPDKIAAKLSLPKISTLHNYPYYDYPMTYGNTKGLLMAKGHMYFLRAFDKVFACSRSVADALLENQKYRVDFIRNGTDTDSFDGLEKAALRSKLALPEDKRVFISTGNIDFRKDPLTVLEAFLVADIPNGLLVFLGDGVLMRKCKERAGGDERILFLGRVNNVPEYLVASDFFVSASLAEGLPNSVMEAMAAGLPCLLSKIPPHDEIHCLNKASSLLFSPTNVSELTSLIRAVANLDCQDMSISSKKIIGTELSAKVMSEKYQQAYLDILGG